MLESCPKCGARWKSYPCGCEYTLEERQRLLSAPALPPPIYGGCRAGLRGELRQRIAEIEAERDVVFNSVTEAFAAGDQDEALFRIAKLNALNKQTDHEYKALRRDYDNMSRVLGNGVICRKRLDVIGDGCRECHEMWRGIDAMGGCRAATMLCYEPGSELPAWQLGWISGIDNAQEPCPFSGDEAREWEKWRRYGWEFFIEPLDGKFCNIDDKP